MKKLSFCITSKNRFYQLSKTLPINLADNRALKDVIEFVVMDFGSEDGLQSWILTNFKNELDDGYVTYFYTDELPKWHTSVAKNTAHYYARGEYLINLDGDNFTGKNGARYVLDILNIYGQKLLLHQFTSDWNSGNCGRIGVHQKYFLQVGGYDESLEPVLHDDMDFIDRLCELGLTYRRFGNSAYSSAILNTREEIVRYSGSQLNARQMEVRNTKASRSNIMSGKIIVNDSYFGIRKNVFSYKDGKIILHENRTKFLV
jgi:hypothetical protein